MKHTYDKKDTVLHVENLSVVYGEKTIIKDINFTEYDTVRPGMNQGQIAGAGIAAHLHQHVVPRWAQDSNFFPIIAGTKAVPRLLGEVRADLAAAWPANH